MNSNQFVRYNRQSNLLSGSYYDLISSTIEVSGNTTLNTASLSGLLYVNGLYANATTIMNNALGFIANLTSDAQAQITVLIGSVSTLNTVVSGNSTNISNILNRITGITYSGGSSQINNALSVAGGIVQTAGSSTFLNTTMGSLTQSTTAIILQSGTGINIMKDIQVPNKTIKSNISSPSSITISSATFSGNTSYTGTAVIVQSGTGTNTLKNTEFTGTVLFDTSISQIAGTSLNNLTTVNTLTTGSVNQTSGTNTFLGSTFTGLINANNS